MEWNVISMSSLKKRHITAALFEIKLFDFILQPPFAVIYRVDIIHVQKDGNQWIGETIAREQKQSVIGLLEIRQITMEVVIKTAMRLIGK